MKKYIFTIAVICLSLITLSVNAADKCQASLNRLHNKYDRLQDKYNEVKDRPRFCPSVRPINNVNSNNISIDNIGIEPRIILKSFAKTEERVVTAAITENVEWLGINIGTSNVDINIIGTGSSTFTQILVANTANDGRESITIPANLAVGTYKVQIKSVTGSVIGVSNTVFVVRATGSASGTPPVPPAPVAPIIPTASLKVNDLAAIVINNQDVDNVKFDWTSTNAKDALNAYAEYSSTCDTNKVKSAGIYGISGTFSLSRSLIKSFLKDNCVYTFTYTVISSTGEKRDSSVTIDVKGPTPVIPTADLKVNGLAVFTISNPNTDVIKYDWTSTNAVSGSAKYNSTCDTTWRNSDNIRGVSGSHSSSRNTIKGLKAGCTYTIKYTSKSITGDLKDSSVTVVVPPKSL